MVLEFNQVKNPEERKILTTRAVTIGNADDYEMIMEMIMK